MIELDKKTLNNVLTAIREYGNPDFKNMSDRQLLHFRYVEMDVNDYKRLSKELSKRELI